MIKGKTLPAELNTQIDQSSKKEKKTVSGLTDTIFFVLQLNYKLLLELFQL